MKHLMAVMAALVVMAFAANALANHCCPGEKAKAGKAEETSCTKVAGPHTATCNHDSATTSTAGKHKAGKH